MTDGPTRTVRAEDRPIFSCDGLFAVEFSETLSHLTYSESETQTRDKFQS